MLRVLSLLLVAVSVASCGVLPPQEATTSEVHSVRAAADPAKTITVSDGLVFYNGSHTAGVRFPPGTYTLEAEDDDYWYFRSVAPLELRKFNGRSVIDGRDIPGGIMLGKSVLRAVPAGGYIDGERTTKVLVWKLGGEFVSLEGRNWKKSF